MTKNKQTPRAFGIWGNTDKDKFWDNLVPILEWAHDKKIEPYITTRIKDNLPKGFEKKVNIINSAKDFLKIDFLLTLGGDGTILSAARAIGNRKTPILGVHVGELGFLAEVTMDDMFDRLNMVSQGNFLIQNRMVLKAEIDNGDTPKTFYALNDFVIDRGKSQRLITMELFANRHFISKYKSDGLIFSTPTGSTAYSLSAGGPIVMPKLKAIVVTPLNPHTLTLRPIVVPDDQILEIKFVDDDKVAFAVDGQVSEYLSPGSRVLIKKSSFDIKMIKFEDSNYSQTLRLKMGWGKRGQI